MASDELANAEVALKQTQEKTGLILLDSQSRAMIESLASLRARVAAQEVFVQQIRTFAAPENPELIREEKALEALREQLSRLEGGQGKRLFADVPIENVPTAGLEYVRKYRGQERSPGAEVWPSSRPHCSEQHVSGAVDGSFDRIFYRGAGTGQGRSAICR
jgi:hypothetical protein